MVMGGYGGQAVKIHFPSTVIFPAAAPPSGAYADLDLSSVVGARTVLILIRVLNSTLFPPFGNVIGYTQLPFTPLCLPGSLLVPQAHARSYWASVFKIRSFCSVSGFDTTPTINHIPKIKLSNTSNCYIEIIF